jgi:D-alanyl-D-alanine carboxypeptidase
LALIAIALFSTCTGTALASDPVSKADRALDRALQRLVKIPGGPPGVIAVVQRGNRREVHTAGVADVMTGAPLRARQYARIGSTAKAFSGAVALSLVDQGVLSLNDTIGERLPDLPEAWHRVTLRELLAHTSGLPDYTASAAFSLAVNASPTFAPPPRGLLAFVKDEPLNFPPGSDYRYSNSDNIVVGLMIEAATGARYEYTLGAKVLAPLGVRQTRMPQGVVLPDPFMHGYASGAPEDVSQLVAFGGWAWASGGLISTPDDLNRFVRAYVGGRMFGEQVRRQQYRFVQGASSDPRGPGQNAAGLGIFRYRTRCGTMFGHTGSIFGYTALIAATPNGRRSLTFTITEQFSNKILPALRKAETQAVCAALARP